jgi:hypothetical protein
MAVTPQGPNSQDNINQVSTGIENAVDRITNLSLGDIARTIKLDLLAKKLVGTESEELKKRSQLLRETNSKVNPILVAFGNDLLGVLVSWFEDPKVLCCLIQNLFTIYLSENLENTPTGQFVKRNYKLSETDFANWIDNLIALIDFIIILLTEDLKRLVIIIPDIIKELYNAMMGAIILLIQETAFALRDSVIRMVFEWMDSIDTEGTWSKCLPFKQLLNVVKKYISDYGILAKILEIIKSHCSAQAAKARIYAASLPPNARDLEYLYWFRDLLIKLKRATLNFDVCVDYEFVGNASVTLEDAKKRKYVTDIKSSDRNNLGNLDEQGGYTIAGDGSVIVDRAKVVNGEWLPRISNDFIREFAHTEYGLPYEVIDNTLTRGTSEDNIQGTLINSPYPGTFSKCIDSPSAEETLKWILNMRSRLS